MIHTDGKPTIANAWLPRGTNATAREASAPRANRTTRTQEYRVTWTIELDATSPENAAQLALQIQRDRASTAVVFEVEQRGRNECTSHVARLYV